jgi:hypothetical protein
MQRFRWRSEIRRTGGWAVATGYVWAPDVKTAKERMRLDWPEGTLAIIRIP